MFQKVYVILGSNDDTGYNVAIKDALDNKDPLSSKTINNINMVIINGNTINLSEINNRMLFNVVCCSLIGTITDRNNDSITTDTEINVSPIE